MLSIGTGNAPAGTALPTAAIAIGRVEVWLGAPLLLDGQPPSEEDGLGFEHR